MRTYGLTGESGSGKSYRAMWIAKKYDIKYVIDDGLLICGVNVITGKSAKREQTKMGSTKRAIFHYDEDAAAMKETLKRVGVESLLILGTSKRMVDLIAERVGADPIEKYIDIHDIATEEEISTAKHIRKTEGMHVIPVPTMAIRKDFQGYFLDPLEILINKARYKEEKTVMRPSYSYMGDYTVDRSVLAEICRHETEKVKDVKAGEIHIKSLKNGVQLYINIIVKDHRNLRSIAAGVQKRTEMALENYVGITVDKIHICVKDILQK